MGDCERFQFTLDRLEDTTGLSRPAIVDAKRWLHRQGLVTWMGGKRPDGGNSRDLLMPREGFRVLEISASPGHCFLEFRPG